MYDRHINDIDTNIYQNNNNITLIVHADGLQYPFFNPVLQVYIIDLNLIFSKFFVQAKKFHIASMVIALRHQIRNLCILFLCSDANNNVQILIKKCTFDLKYRNLYKKHHNEYKENRKPIHNTYQPPPTPQ